MKCRAFLSAALMGLVAAQSDNGTSLADALSSKNSTLSTLRGLLDSQPSLLSSLSDLKNITILAPSNDALRDFLNDTSVSDIVASDPGAISAILSYHVLNGTWFASNFTDTPVFVPTLLNNATWANVTGGQVVEGMSLNNTVRFYSALRAQSNVTDANLNFTGGVIHVINRVLEIPKNLTETAVDANVTAATGALDKASLGSTLVDEKDITVFVPNNGAFANIGSVAANLSDSDLKKILQYHVVNGTVAYSTLLKNETLETAEGGSVHVTVEDGNVFVNQAKVVVPDVLIANGVVHVIDGVLNPDNPSATADPTAKTQTPAFTGASSISSVGVPFTSGVSQPTETATGLTTSTSTEAGPKATAAVALGALLGGAAVVLNL